MAEDKYTRVKNSIGVYPDFPKPKINFRDIFSVCRDPSLFKDLNDLIIGAVKESLCDLECVIGLESRGFLIGPILAQTLNIPFVPIRKKGKLPGELISQSYDLEYGSDTLEIQKSSLEANQKVLIIDDLLATGGTMRAACDLVEKAGAQVSLCLVVIELTELKGTAFVGKHVKSIFTF